VFTVWYELGLEIRHIVSSLRVNVILLIRGTEVKVEQHIW